MRLGRTAQDVAVVRNVAHESDDDGENTEQCFVVVHSPSISRLPAEECFAEFNSRYVEHTDQYDAE